MGRRAGLVCALLLVGGVLLAGPAGAVTNPPNLKVEVIGAGSVSANGISCGLGNLTCYTAYGSSTQSVTLTPTASSGWAFDHWEDGATSCGTTASCTITVDTTAPVTATAVFKTTSPVQTSTFNVSSTNNGAVTNSSTNYPVNCDPGATPTPATVCSVTVLQGSTITVVEAPHSGYFFGGWSGGCGGTSVSCAVYLSGTQSASANFVATSSNTLTVSAAGNGSVAGGGISCGAGSTCDAPEPPNSSVTLTATAQSGYVLTGWSGACTGTQSTCTVQMDAARSVTATFAQLVPLSVTNSAPSGIGEVTGGGIDCTSNQTCTAGEAPNTTVTLTAIPASGGSVLWSGCTTTAGNLCSVTIGTTPAAVSASFSGGTVPPIATNLLSITVKGDGYVIATAGSASIYCTAAGGSGCSATVPANTSLTLSAIPASGSAGDFTHWLGDCSSFTTTTCSLTMTSAKTVEADFAGGNTTYLLTGQIVGNGTISGAGLRCSSTGGVGCSVSQAASATVTLTASPGFGTTFTGWSGACSGTGTCTISMTSAKSATATFTTAAPTTVDLSISVIGGGTVTATGGACSNTAGKSKTCTQKYDLGKAVTLTVKPEGGASFTGWAGLCAGKRTTCVVTMTSSESVSATFTLPVFGATRKAAVAKIKTGYKVTLYYTTDAAGTLKLVATRSGKSVLKTSTKVKVGAGKVSFTVAKAGRYVFTLTLGKHSLRWGIPVR